MRNKKLEFVIEIEGMGQPDFCRKKGGTTIRQPNSPNP